jgi:hypothetical protein
MKRAIQFLFFFGLLLATSPAFGHCDPDGRCARATGNWATDIASSASHLISNTYGAVGYAGMYMFSSDTAERYYGQQARGLLGTFTGATQTAYDAAAFASYEMLSPLAPSQTAQAYGPSLDRLDQALNGFTGGEGNSAAYRGTYTTLNAATIVLGGEAGQYGRFERMGGTVGDATAEGPTALSPYRITTAGETFSHYGFAEDAAGFQGGLRPGAFVTSAGNLSGAEAQSGLALPNATPPNAVYGVAPAAGTWIRVNPVTAPQFGQPGGLPEYQFPGGTGSGTVSPPRRIPLQP